MKKKIIAAMLLLSVCIIASSFAATQKIIPLSDPFYGQIDLMYLLDGRVRPSTSRPWSLEEAEKVFVAVKESRRVPAWLSKEVEGRLEAQGLRFNLGDKASGDVHLDLSLEGYGHTETEKVKLEDQWVHDADDRLPLVRERVEFAFDPGIYAYCDAQYGYGRMEPDSDYYTTSASEFETYFPYGVGALIPYSSISDGLRYQFENDHYSRALDWNVPPATAYFDFNWPKRALLSIGGSYWNFNFSRDRMDWGNSYIGNFVIDNHVDYHEYLRFSAFSDRFKSDFVTMFFDDNPYHDEDADSDVRMLLGHRFELWGTPRFSVSVSENVMYKTSDFDLRYLNPAFIYHNINNRSMFNALLSAGVNTSLFTGFELYGQFVLDQAQAPNEDSSQSTAWGALAGVQYVHPMGKGVLRLVGEAAATTPCLYRRDQVDFLMYNKYFTIDGVSYALDFDYIGFPYGGDAVVTKLMVEYQLPDSTSFSISWLHHAHGEVTMAYPLYVDSSGNPCHDEDYGSTIFKNGVCSRMDIIDLQVSCQWKTKHATLRPEASLAGVWYRAYDHVYTGTKLSDQVADSYFDLQLTIGMTVSI